MCRFHAPARNELGQPLQFDCSTAAHGRAHCCPIATDRLRAIENCIRTGLPRRSGRRREFNPSLTHPPENSNQTIIPGRIVLPLERSSDAHILVNGQKLQFKEYCVEMGCVVTFHKCQGKTMSKIILDLNKPQSEGPLRPHFLQHVCRFVACALGQRCKAVSTPSPSWTSPWRAGAPSATAAQWRSEGVASRPRL